MKSELGQRLRCCTCFDEHFVRTGGRTTMRSSCKAWIRTGSPTPSSLWVHLFKALHRAVRCGLGTCTLTSGSLAIHKEERTREQDRVVERIPHSLGNDVGRLRQDDCEKK